MSLASLARLGADHGALGWYADARHKACVLALALDQCSDYTIDVLAILSPRVPVARNLSMTADYLSGVCPSQLPTVPSVKRSLANYEKDGRVRGSKVRRFADAIRGNTSAVVVDTWILQALGYDPPSSDLQYRRIAAHIQELSYRLKRIDARHERWTPRDTQAAVWTGYQLSLGRTPALFPDPMEIL